MKAASINELKKELVRLDEGELLEACLRLARFKKENKELLTYLVFASKNESGYLNSVCCEIDELFAETKQRKSLYLAKKGIRKIIKMMDRYARYSAIKETEIEMRIHFCQSLNRSGIAYKKSKVMTNMYNSQIKKIEKQMEKLHRDIQTEYRRQLQQL